MELLWKSAVLLCLTLVGLETKSCKPPEPIDGIPIVSQVKSLVQEIEGDQEGAECTQVAFSKETPIVSQIRSAVEAGTGDLKAAKETQELFLDNTVRAAEGTPLLGHAIGAGEMIAGDTKRGEETLKSASRSTAILVGDVAAGPAGAAVGSLVYDGIMSGIEGKPSGIYDTIVNFKELSKDPAKAFDAVAGTGLEVFGGPPIPGLKRFRTKLDLPESEAAVSRVGSKTGVVNDLTGVKSEHIPIKTEVVNDISGVNSKLLAVKTKLLNDNTVVKSNEIPGVKSEPIPVKTEVINDISPAKTNVLNDNTVVKSNEVPGVKSEHIPVKTEVVNDISPAKTDVLNDITVMKSNKIPGVKSENIPVKTEVVNDISVVKSKLLPVLTKVLNSAKSNNIPIKTGVTNDVFRPVVKVI